MAYKTVTLSYALQYKNKLVRLVNDAKQDVKTYNTVDEGEEPELDVLVRFSEYQALQVRLCKLKTAISAANGPVQELIYLQAEIKDRIAFIKGFATKKRARPSRYDDSTAIQVSTISKKNVDEWVKKFERELEEIQATLTAHNAATTIDIWVVDED